MPGALRRPAQAATLSARTTPARRADPCPGGVACVRIVLADDGAAATTVALSLVSDDGTRATLARPSLTIPPSGRREAEIAVAAAGPSGLAAGRLVAHDEEGSAVLTHPFAIATAPPDPPPLGPLTLQRESDRVTGVRELLPAEYAYELPAGTLRSLPRGRYAFRAVARSPGGGMPATALSEPFAL